MENRENRFVTDITIPDMYFAVTIRSPAAKGRLKGVSCPQCPAAYALITAKDIAGENKIDGFPVPVLAEDALTYIGEPVALLVGPDEVKLGEYAAQCAVLCDEEEPSFAESVIVAERNIVLGEPFDADMVKKTIKGVYKTGIQEHWYSEPHSALAFFEKSKKNGGLIVYTATQWAFHVTRSVSQVLKIPAERVTVIPTKLGVHMDGKLWYPSLISCHAALAASLVNKPVKLCLTREEDFRFSPKRNASEIKITSSLDENGEVLGNDVSILVDLGANSVFSDEIIDKTCLGALGLYRIPFTSIKAKAIRTNIPAQGEFAGFGLSQGFFASEMQASRIADETRIDPTEWRKQRLLRKKDGLAIADAPFKDLISIEKVIETVSIMSDYERKWASYELLRLQGRVKPENKPLRGIGIASAYQGNGFFYHSKTDKGVYTVEAVLKENERVAIRTSAATANSMWARILRQIAAKILDIDEDMVEIAVENAPDSGPAGNSRNIAVVAKLVERCCLALKKQRASANLPLAVSKSVKPIKTPAWSEKKIDKNALSSVSWGAAVVEIEIESASYVPKIRGIWIFVDGGRILSEKRAERAMRSAIIHALGWASRENIAYTNGKIEDALIYNYDIPSPADIPPIYVQFLKSNADPKGIGEIPFSVIPAAYAQAASQALDRVFEKIPLTSKAIWEASQ
jgi:CO/xanthine dehydrogenase Mo-binding subunit